MRNSDIELIVAKVTKRLSSLLNSENGLEELQESAAEEVEKECRYLEWSRQSHAERMLKIILWWLLGVALVVGIVAWSVLDRNAKSIHDAERKARWADEDKESERFNRDYAGVVDLVYQRDEAIYRNLISENRKLLAAFEEMRNSIKDKTAYRISLEEQMIARLKSEIHHCELVIRRIEFDRDNAPQKAKWLEFEVFARSCDCHAE